jgi:hypothetical protein
MIDKPNVCIIGAAKSGSGKTTFACSLIAKHLSHGPIAVKITTISDESDGCPSGKNCGVCTSIGENYEIIRELAPGGDKDTNKLLASGAKRVYWLRAKRACLEAGISAILDEAGNGECFIIESNSARTAIDPGLFIVTKERASDTMKPSCREVIAFADAVIDFDDFNSALSAIDYEEGRWKLDPDFRSKKL